MTEKELQDIRVNYSKATLDEGDVGDDPFEFFRKWMKESLDSQVLEPTAMALSTVSLQGKPSSRIVLLKGLEDELFKFYSNYDSQKGQELEINPYAGLLFFWPELERQVRIDGKIEKLSREESSSYFNSRPRESRIGSHASHQSHILSSRQELEERFRELSASFGEDGEIPIPDSWGGYGLKAISIEFWQGRQSRLHDRIRFRKVGDNWTKERLSP